MKVAILGELLGRAGLGDLPEITAVSGDPLGYRNRIRLHLDRATSALCYKERGAHRNLPVSECPIAAPSLEQALGDFRVVARAMNLGERSTEVEFFTNHDSSELLLSLWSARPATEAELRNIAEALPGLTGAAVFTARPARGRQRQEEEDATAAGPIAAWGAPSLTYAAAGERYRVSAGAFFQGNRFLVDTLVALATSRAQGRLAWDLYAGVGLFSKVLARSFEQVIAVEGAGPSSADLRANLPAHRTVQSGIAEFLRKPVRERPDFVLVDPPRAGMGAEITSLLSRIGPPLITYVSCDPATLARDLAALVSSGYRIRTLHMVDLFPQTYHLETVAHLGRE
jgi:23S rRNA (uracil1939-C5)-methyltransferase